MYSCIFSHMNPCIYYLLTCNFCDLSLKGTVPEDRFVFVHQIALSGGAYGGHVWIGLWCLGVWGTLVDPCYLQVLNRAECRSAVTAL